MAKQKKSTSKNHPTIILFLKVVAIIFLTVLIVDFIKKEAVRRDIRALQEEVSTYIAENYEGVKTIRWRGWGFPPKSDTPGTSMIINDFDPDRYGNVILAYYLEKDNSETPIEFTDRWLNTDNDSNNNGLINYHREGVIKSKKGSPNAKIYYNLEEWDTTRE